MRRCSKCAIEKPANTEYFNRHKNGLRPECKTCQSEYRREYGRRRQVELNARAADYREANRLALAAKQAVRYAALADDERRARNRAYGLKSGYGITVEQYDEMLEAQGGTCAICRKRGGSKALAVDHDHNTGRIRGLLCIRCNTALGALGDNEAGIERVLRYLRGLP